MSAPVLLVHGKEVNIYEVIGAFRTKLQLLIQTRLTTHCMGSCSVDHLALESHHHHHDLHLNQRYHWNECYVVRQPCNPNGYEGQLVIMCKVYKNEVKTSSSYNIKKSLQFGLP